MRIGTLVALCALVALPAGGCFVLDELDAGAKEMERYSGKAPAESEPAAQPGSPGPPKDAWRDKLADVTEWWKKARTLASEPLDERIVRCRLDGRDLFMDVDQCRARGGRAGS